MAVVSVRVSKIDPLGALRIRTWMGVNPTALAAQGAVVRTGSGWTHAIGGSCVDDAADCNPNCNHAPLGAHALDLSRPTARGYAGSPGLAQQSRRRLPGRGPHRRIVRLNPAFSSVVTRTGSGPFRSVRDLGRAAARCSRQSGKLEGRSSAWLPAWLLAAHDTGHRDALVLVANIGSPTGKWTAPGPAQTPPPNPTAAEPDGRRVLSRVGVADHEVTPKAPWTGSGWREYSYSGFGGGHPHFHGDADCRNLNLVDVGLSAWELDRSWPITPLRS